MSTFGKMPTSHQTNPWFRHRRAHAHAPHPANQDHVKSGMQYQLLQYLSKPLLHPVHFQDALHLQQVQHTCTCCDTTLPQPPLLHTDSVSKSEERHADKFRMQHPAGSAAVSSHQFVTPTDSSAHSSRLSLIPGAAMPLKVNTVR